MSTPAGEAAQGRVGEWRYGPIASRYEVGERLGRGGMGEVYAARDTRTGRRVALKLLRRGVAAPRGVERLLREATAASRVVHPGVVRVLEAGEDPVHDVAFIAQELLVGETLRARLHRRGRLGSAEAVALLVPVVEALVAAHAAGVVHRDLKPENIFLEGAPESPRPRVIDFGIARLVAPDDAAGAQLTATGSLLGTPDYMSPEQVRGTADVDEQTDVWALGVVLHELLTGAAPFARATPHATLAAILLDPVPSPREQVAEVPEALARVVRRCLARRRLERFASMAELAAALRPWVASAPASPSGEAPTRSAASVRWLKGAGLAVLGGLAILRGGAAPPRVPREVPPVVRVTAPAAPVVVARTPAAVVAPAPPLPSPSAAPRAGRSAMSRLSRATPAARPAPPAAPAPLPRTNGAFIVGL